MGEKKSSRTVGSTLVTTPRISRLGPQTCQLVRDHHKRGQGRFAAPNMAASTPARWMFFPRFPPHPWLGPEHWLIKASDEEILSRAKSPSAYGQSLQEKTSHHGNNLDVLQWLVDGRMRIAPAFRAVQHASIETRNGRRFMATTYSDS